MASSLTAQSAFLNNLEDIVNRRVDIREDIKRHQGTLSHALSEVDYSIGENIYMLPSNMKLKIKTGTVLYNNKVLISDGKFNPGKNEKVNLMVPAIKSHKTNSLQGLAQEPNFSHVKQEHHPITHNEEKLPFYFSLQVVLQYGIFFYESSIKEGMFLYGSSANVIHNHYINDMSV